METFTPPASQATPWGLASTPNRPVRGAMVAWGPRIRSREFRRALRKRVALGLFMALFSTVVGWVLVPPEVVTDQATVDWYTQ